MNRRTFLASAASGLLGTAFGLNGFSAQDRNARQLLELRVYHFEDAAQRDRFARFVGEVAVPALNRIGIRPVGVWQMHEASLKRMPEEFESTDLVVLLPHNSMDSVIRLIEMLSEDHDFIAQAAEVVASRQPPYKRFESSLSVAFTEMPRVEIPTLAPSRIAQLRIYESPNDERALAKIEMFNTGGELRIFRKVGLTPVFFGQTLIGTRLPKLTYMLSFPSQEVMDKAWRAFLDDPEWKVLSKDPAYENTVSRITNLILQPVAGSQI